MTTHDSIDPGASPSLEEQAAAVHIRQNTDDRTAFDQAEIDSWLAVPAHARAYRRIQRTWRAVGDHSASAELIALRGDALARVRGDGRTWGSRRPAAAGWKWAAGALAVVLVAVGSRGLIGDLWGTVYRTPPGKQRIIRLADRSQIALDESTALRVRMTRDARVVDLLKGQAQFMVAHDPRRPFLVEAGGNTITAVGTSFNVEYLDARMKVDMVEGKVVVAVAATVPAPESAGRPRAAYADRTLDLAAGEELDVQAGGQAKVVHGADIDAAIAWRQDKIIFKDTPLGEAVRRLNRYSKLQISISDSSLAQERISGVFDRGDTMVFARAVQSSLPVTAQLAGPDQLILSPAP